MISPLIDGQAQLPEKDGLAAFEIYILLFTRKFLMSGFICHKGRTNTFLILPTFANSP